MEINEILNKIRLLGLDNLYVCGLNWKVLSENGLCSDRDCFAEVRPRTQEIVYDSDLIDERILSSLIHEVIEIIVNEAEMKTIEHKDIQVIANEFCTFLLDNKLLKEE